MEAFPLYKKTLEKVPSFARDVCEDELKDLLHLVEKKVDADVLASHFREYNKTGKASPLMGSFNQYRPSLPVDLSENMVSLFKRYDQKEKVIASMTSSKMRLVQEIKEEESKHFTFRLSTEQLVKRLNNRWTSEFEHLTQEEHESLRMLMSDVIEFVEDASKELRHKKRAVWGCIWKLCRLQFSTEEEWKLHLSKHKILERWRCCVKDTSSAIGTCAKVLYQREAFLDHIRSHGIKHGKDTVAEECQLGPNNNGRFWCGFCQECVSVKTEGLEIWDEYLDHIRSHELLAEEWYPEDEHCKMAEIGPMFPVNYC